MTQAEYTTERDLLIEAKGFRIPTKAFITEFQDRLPELPSIPIRYRLMDESWQWGYALFGKWVDAQAVMDSIGLWTWVNIYESEDPNELEDNLKDILEGINLKQEKDEEEATFKPGTLVMFRALGMETEISEGLGITRKELKKLDGTIAKVQSIETYSGLGDKDYEYYNIKFESNGYELFALSGYHLEPIQ